MRPIFYENTAYLGFSNSTTYVDLNCARGFICTVYTNISVNVTVLTKTAGIRQDTDT